jgi:hypothetical protein
MAVTKEDIRTWLERGVETKATHVIVVVDTFSYDDYPVFVEESENIRDVIKRYDNVNMQRIMEIYNLHKDIEKQLNERRSYNL